MHFVQDSCSVIPSQDQVPEDNENDFFVPDQLMCRLLDVKWHSDNGARIYFRYEKTSKNSQSVILVLLQ